MAAPRLLRLAPPPARLSFATVSATSRPGTPCPAAGGAAPPVGLGRDWDCGRTAVPESADAAGRSRGLPLLPGLRAGPGCPGREVPGLGPALPAGAPAPGPHRLGAWGYSCPSVSDPKCEAHVGPRRVCPGPRGTFLLSLHPSHSRFIQSVQPGRQRASYSGRGHARCTLNCSRTRRVGSPLEGRGQFISLEGSCSAAL